MLLTTATFVPCLFAVSPTNYSRVKSDDGRFISSISVFLECPTQSISLDNRKEDLARSFRYHPLMLSTAIDVRPRKKGEKEHTRDNLHIQLCPAKYQELKRRFYTTPAGIRTVIQSFNGVDY